MYAHSRSPQRNQSIFSGSNSGSGASSGGEEELLEVEKRGFTTSTVETGKGGLGEGMMEDDREFIMIVQQVCYLFSGFVVAVCFF